MQTSLLGVGGSLRSSSPGRTTVRFPTGELQKGGGLALEFSQANVKSLKFGCNGPKGERDVAMEGVKLKKIKKMLPKG